MSNIYILKIMLDHMCPRVRKYVVTYMSEDI